MLWFLGIAVKFPSREKRVGFRRAHVIALRR